MLKFVRPIALAALLSACNDVDGSWQVKQETGPMGPLNMAALLDDGRKTGVVFACDLQNGPVFIFVPDVKWDGSGVEGKEGYLIVEVDGESVLNVPVKAQKADKGWVSIVAIADQVGPMSKAIKETSKSLRATFTAYGKAPITRSYGLTGASEPIGVAMTVCR